MKTIQWFPGHMAKAVRMMESDMGVADGVIYVLDARCPAATFNPMLKKIAGAKPVLYVLNKSDLADERADVLLDLIKKQGVPAVKINSANLSSRRDIMGAIENLVAEKRQKAAQKGYNKTFRFMVSGVPNTGKSTLINMIAGGRRAETGDKAGVTRGRQWIRLGGFELLDTPGVMPPSIKEQTLALRLAYVGCLNDEILDKDDICLGLLEELKNKYPARLEARYGISEGAPIELLNGVCSRMGYILRGGEYDYDRACRGVIDDFRKGRLGRITLDGPADIGQIEY